MHAYKKTLIYERFFVFNFSKSQKQLNLQNIKPKFSKFTNYLLVFGAFCHFYGLINN
ncbi:hypothetical protein BXY80_0852 [Ichthyenterobacterium magnum]|uniref:Uncharacterized protein n=1 Tax=Ichthyenterobacterium magnum TaxID=1230530 RepID=A0A420DX22_9FLAO|nr:hypothetical protein BXY80_0852 [Ichthyenterobacterium magnum]